jgi:anti-sigma factor ChrR (cupin superfamily)
MNLNADFNCRATVHCDAIAWMDSPMPGVSRKMLDRVGDEVARATSVVRYLKLNREMGLLLHDRSSRQNTGAQRNIAHMQFDQITSSQFAIDRKVNSARFRVR